MHRRDFLQISLLGALMPYLGCRKREDDDQAKYTVAIIGAGIAGLAAARSLVDLGHTVFLLEGRDRIGGRIYTDRTTISGSTLDLGASWIHGITGNPISTLAQQAGLTTVKTDYNSTTVRNSSGSIVNVDSIDKSFAAFNSFRKAKLANLSDSTGLQSIVNDYVASAGLTGEALVQFFWKINTEIEHEFAADASTLSGKNYDEGEDPYPGGDVVFPNGFDQIFSQLTSGLDVRLSQIVKLIEASAGGVTVTTDQGAFNADYAICTVPLGILKADTIKFTPALPEPISAAISKLGMGILNKTYISFPTAFWDKTDIIGYIDSGTKGHWAEHLNFDKVAKKKVLLCFNAGAKGASVENLTDTEIQSEVTKVLASMYGSAAVPTPTGIVNTRWAKDNFAKGSYSYLAAGSTAADRKAFATPVGERIYFAGEHTSLEYPATVHGALLSGQNVAGKIHALAVRD